MCGISGVFGHKEASKLNYLMLYALQHRGQESCGIVSANIGSGVLNSHREMGYVRDVFTSDVLRELSGTISIGHDRYSTTGIPDKKNIQPILAKGYRGPIAIGHNGNLVNAVEVRRLLEESGAIFQSSSDTEIFLHLIAHSKQNRLIDRVQEALGRVEGAFSLLIATDNHLIAVRDPFGFHPLVLGKLDNSYVLASETCAFDLINAEFIREIEPGEVLVMDKDGERSYFPFLKQKKLAQCVFEFIYFARPDSIVFGKSVNTVREKLGIELGEINQVEADIVIALPDSGNPSALGYARSSGIPFGFGFIRNHYIGRTFIEPAQEIRGFGVKIKLNPVESVVRDKKVMVVDDSIVRANTTKKTNRMLRDAGVAEIHNRSSCPQVKYGCYFGIDTPKSSELIANQYCDEEIRYKIGADSLVYQTMDGLRRAIGDDCDNFCYACLDGIYPIKIPDELKLGKML